MLHIWPTINLSDIFVGLYSLFILVTDQGFTLVSFEFVALVWPLCSNFLRQVARYCMASDENGQIFVAIFLDVACCARMASSFATSHNTMEQCAINCVEILRAFDRAFMQTLDVD